MSEERKLRVLVVDDDRSFRKYLTMIFEERGYFVIEAKNGNEALQILSENSVDVVFSDVQMPNGNGIELCQEAKRRWPEIPLFLMSGAINTRTLSAQAPRANGFFEKPFSNSDLLIHIETALRQVA